MYNNRNQRPLQKSMFLPTSEPYINTNNTTNYQYQGLVEMKRSALNPDSHNNYSMNSMNQGQQNHHYTNLSQPILNFNQTPRQKQQPQKLSNFGNYNPLTTSSQINIKQISQKLDRVMNLVENHDEILKSINLPSINSKQKSLQSNEIQSKIRDQIVPNLINQATKDIYEHIFNFKFEIQTMKDEIQRVNVQYKAEIANWLSKEGNQSQTSRANSSSTLASDRADDSILSGTELSSSFYSLESKFAELQKNLQNRDDYFKSFVQFEIEKCQFKITADNKRQLSFSPNRGLKSGVQSSLSPILLEYQEYFIVKSQKPQLSSKSGNLSKQLIQNSPTQILINSCTYYIDPSGYLLDQQNRYILDHKGMQIKLDEKHINLLKQHHVLAG